MKKAATTIKATKETKVKKASVVTKQKTEKPTKVVVTKKAVGKPSSAPTKVVTTAGKPEKVAKKTVPSSLSAPVFTPNGKEDGTISLPAFYFDAKVNPALMAQAVRVYLANRREGSAHTKTRGRVEGSTRKIYKQKGTGRARHGAIRAPIFVGGGVALGPQAHEFTMNLPQKMRVRALASALTNQYKEGAVKVVAKLETLPQKTKEFAKAFKSLDVTGKTLVLYGKEEQSLVRSIRNIDEVHILMVAQLNAYEVLTHQHIVFTRQAVGELQ